MSRRVSEIGAAIAAQGMRGRREPYSERVQELVAAYGKEQRRGGASWRQIASQLGMNVTTVVRYSRRHSLDVEERTSMVPVVVTAHRSAQSDGMLVLVSPSGFRLEGLGLDAAVRVLGSLR